YCSISKGLGFLDSAHPLDTLTSSAAMFRPNNQLFSTVQTEEVRAFSKGFSVTPPAFPVIGNDVWIGANVTLAPKITIGTGAVIAADSVVTKDVAPYEIVGGNPAKHIRMRFPEERVQALLESQWWEYEPSQVFSNDPRDIDSILERIDAGHIDRYEPRSITLDPQDPALQPKPAGSKPNSTRSKPRTVGQKIAKKILRRARNSWGGDRYRR
ncbi:MAG: CatB-related O-acetyltransferase, partial [Ancrocorticia sp.]